MAIYSFLFIQHNLEIFSFKHTTGAHQNLSTTVLFKIYFWILLSTVEGGLQFIVNYVYKLGLIPTQYVLTIH